jgi:hypothetical protein
VPRRKSSRQTASSLSAARRILGSWTEDRLPDEATQSTEVDLVPLNDDDAGSLATLLDGAIGEWLNFHQTHGFYVQGVSTATAVLPVGWQDRLVRVSGGGTNGRTGLCLEPQDVCLAKLAAHREKDTRFVAHSSPWAWLRRASFWSRSLT